MRRRGFLQGSGGLLSLSALGSSASSEAAATSLSELRSPNAAPDTVAADESYWGHVQKLFRQDSDYVWLAHGAGGAVPQAVVEYMGRVAAESATGRWEFPAFKGIKESGSSSALRERMARTFGCEAGEITVARNAMEALATCLLGFDLRAGDEVLTTSSDYDSCIAILEQRARRDGIKVRLVDIPTPIQTAESVVAAIEQAITPRTRMILISHMTYGTGQILPVSEICALARRHGALSVVDGAHAIGHLDFRIDELGCDCFASCLHKWFLGPRGTGILYVRKERIKDIWPLFGSYTNKAATDIEKFEEYGTVSKAVSAALPLAFDFNERIGIRAKQSRLRYLRDRWAKPLQQHERVRLWTNLDPRWSCGVAAFDIEGIEPDKIVAELRDKHGLRVRALANPFLPRVRGINVGLTLVNNAEHADRFVSALTEVIAR